ncbi:Rho-binding antiterminator [Vibrio diabolicus]|uniref:Rho-binding antiterminator n=1 Tax=Vibrio diabolicus TaxID=50719 RepID=UPI00080F4581|nr:Rho-binding antiterminator [Vibrio diabolicus]MCS0316398.1 Rho-binding antiterminator [Vibrio diabolicus]OCH71696.1 transcriptional regulator [Vibrio diabolicus]
MVTCSQYDFIEIACMFKLPIEITLKNGETHQGNAFDTGYDMQPQECLFLDMDGEHIAFPTEQLVAMRALKANPHFDEVTFE